MDPRALGMNELYAAGMSLNQVGKRYGVTGATVKRVLLDSGFEIRSYEESMRLYATQGSGVETTVEVLPPSLPKHPDRQKRPRVGGRKASTDAARVRPMYEAYLAGATLAEVGAEFDLTRERVRQLFKAAGLPTRDVAAAARLSAALRRDEQRNEAAQVERVTKEISGQVRIEVAVAHFKRTGALQAAADAGGIAVATLRRHLRLRGEPLPPTSRERVILQLLAEHRSKAEIATAVGVPRAEFGRSMSALMEKLQCEDRASAVSVARERGWL